MKRFAIIFLSLFYLLITSGFVVNVHYCMGKLASVELGRSISDICSFCGMQEQSDCCQTDEQHYKVDDEHQVISANFLMNVEEVDDIIALPFYQEFLAPLQAQRVLLYNQYHSPPDPKQNQIFLYNCNFRI